MFIDVFFILQYGTTALVWACRKGTVDIVDSLLKAGANVDTAGMVILFCIFVVLRYCMCSLIKYLTNQLSDNKSQCSL